MSDNPVAIVTGGSRGVGAATAKILSENGWNVIITCSSSIEDAKLVAANCSNKSTEVFAFQADVANEQDCIATIDKAIEKWKRIDALINNAGTSDPKRFKDLDEESWNYVLNTNLNGAYRVAKNFTDQLIKSKKSGSIVNIASILGLRVGFNLSSYATAKAGLIQLTKSMALELARSNIRVNAIAPGYILTEINDDFFATKEGQDYINNIPMRRLGLESDLDGILLLLASDASSFMTGSIIPVDGGHLNNPL